MSRSNNGEGRDKDWHYLLALTGLGLKAFRS